MPGEMYDQLVSEPNSGLRWFCESCEKMAVEKNSGTPSGQNDKLDALIVVIEKLMARYESVEKKLESKSDADQVERLEQKLKELEEKIAKFDSDTEPRLSTIEQQLQSNTTACSTMKDNGITDEEMIKFVIQEEMKKNTTEDEDLENRKRNIIMYRIPEKKTERVSDRRESDWFLSKT